jgi:hypothetical protein
MEEITLEKIDIIRQRTGLGYQDAKEALEKNNGSVVDTLVYIEQNQKSFTQNVTDASNELVDTIKDIIKKGNVNRIKVKKDNKVLVDIPVTAGIAAGAITLFSPALLAIGAVAALVSKITIEIERPDGRIEVVNDVVSQTFEDVKDKVEDVKEKVENVVEQTFEKVNDFKQELQGNQNTSNTDTKNDNNLE